MLGSRYCCFCGEALFEQAQASAVERPIQEWIPPALPNLYPVFPTLVRPTLPIGLWIPYMIY
jgi:hypothetical protein